MSFSSWTDVANEALSLLGAGRVNNILEDSKNARLCNQNYESARDYVLRKQPWKSATVRETLAPLSDSPVFGYGYAFQVPTRYLRLVNIYPKGTPFKREGRQILTDASSLEMSYVQAVETPINLDPLLTTAISTYLSYLICFAITSDIELRREIKKDYLQAYREAKSVDGQESSLDIWESTMFLDSRQIGVDPGSGPYLGNGY